MPMPTLASEKVPFLLPLTATKTFRLRLSGKLTGLSMYIRRGPGVKKFGDVSDF